MSKQDWIWMPHAGHFICGSDCRFHLNTYVNGFIVSTVGELWPDSTVRKIRSDVRGVVVKGRGDEWDANYFKEFGYHEVGLDRLYETMVFPAIPSKIQCCPYKTTPSSTELECEGYNSPEEAFKGHYELCEKYDKYKEKEV